MSSIITGILNSTIGLLWNKARDLTAAKLQDGDVTDAKIREIVVRELNDIKTKLDGLCRKDLLSSYSFLREGVDLLNVCLDRSTHSAQQYRDESSTMSWDVTSAILNEVLELTRAVEKIKIKSCGGYESARKRFEDARKKATEAFCNEAMKIEDRILAAKLRVVSEILENLESPKTAITGCLSFLRDLHSLPAIHEIFSVFLNGGIKSLGKEERAANVKSIMLINSVLFQFTLEFGGKLTDRLNWSAGIIELADRSFNPVLEWQKVSSKKSIGGELSQPPNEPLVLDEEIISYTSAVNSHGETVVKHSDDEMKIISRAGLTNVVKLPKTSEGKLLKSGIETLAVDHSNNIYVVSYLTTRTETDVIIIYVLHVLDDDYNVTHVGSLDFLEQIDNGSWISLAISRSNDIIMITDDDSSVYISDNSGKLKNMFQRDSNYRCNLSISNRNEIMIASDNLVAVNLYTEEGNLTSTVKLPEGFIVEGMTFHYVLGKIIVMACLEKKESCFLLCYSDVGELESSTFFCDVCRHEFGPSIASHPGGPVAVVREKSITFI